MRVSYRYSRCSEYRILFLFTSLAFAGKYAISPKQFKQFNTKSIRTEKNKQGIQRALDQRQHNQINYCFIHLHFDFEANNGDVI